MSTTILINLLACTYGATAWSRAHIEAEIELVPSPVRLLRAIISGAYKVDEMTGDSDLLREVITELSRTMPRYHVPNGTYIAHNTYRKDKAGLRGELHKSGKLYAEPYVEYGPDEAFFVVRWDVELDDRQRMLLSDCLANIGYLGRSEHVAQWCLLGRDEEIEVEFNGVPRVGGGCLVLMAGPEVVGELWVVPGERNSRFVSHPFVEVGYGVSFGARERVSFGLPPVNQLVFFADISYEFDVRWTIDWCDLLHKALCKALPESEVFRSGTCITLSGRVFTVDALAFSDAEVAAAQGVRRLWRYDLDGVEVWLERASLVERVRCGDLCSVTPFFMGLAPARKARKSGTYGVKLVAGGAFEKMGVEFQAIRELLLRDGWGKAEVGELVWVAGDEGALMAMSLDGDLVASCRAEVWPNVGEVWRSVRRCGSRGIWLRPARSVAYKLVMCYPRGVAGGMSLGFGASFGLGMLR